MRPEKILPTNKRLTLKEHIAVLGYHYGQVDRYFWTGNRDLNWKKHKAKRLHVRAMHSLGADLRRFGIHGYGEPEGFNGIVVFEPSRLIYDRRIGVQKSIWSERICADDFDALKSSWEIGIDPVRLTSD